MGSMKLIDVVLFANQALNDSEELALGMQRLRRALCKVHRWYTVNDRASMPAMEFLKVSEADQILVILESALIVSDNLLTELIATDPSTPESWECVMPSDERGYTTGVNIDYATGSGFERFVRRLAAGPRWVEYDGRKPWIYLIDRKALEVLAETHTTLSWFDVPALLDNGTIIAQHAYVHSFADYYFNSRSEMLRLLPKETCCLLDVGGGGGNFSHAFMTEHGGEATLLERNHQVAECARSRGVKILLGEFQSVSVTAQYDCVAFLDVLEHLLDPLGALVKAHQILEPGGRLLLSVPNVGHWTIVSDLLEGRFDYQPVGILCNTHLRFYTQLSLEALLADAGFTVERWENISSPPPASFSQLMANNVVPGVTPNSESLATVSFHVLARRD